MDSKTKKQLSLKRTLEIIQELEQNGFDNKLYGWIEFIKKATFTNFGNLQSLLYF